MRENGQRVARRAADWAAKLQMPPRDMTNLIVAALTASASQSNTSQRSL